MNTSSSSSWLSSISSVWVDSGAVCRPISAIRASVTNMVAMLPQLLFTELVSMTTCAYLAMGFSIVLVMRMTGIPRWFATSAASMVALVQGQTENTTSTLSVSRRRTRSMRKSGSLLSCLVFG